MDKEYNVLAIDEEFSPILLESECEAIKPVMKDFMECYVENKDKPVDEWLSKKLQQELPEKSSEEIQLITQEIISTIKVNEEKKVSLAKAIENGQSKDSWFASEVKKVTSAMSTQASVQYLKNLDIALVKANDAMARTITTQVGAINQNPCLDGFIAEQYHAQTFNLNAEAAGSPYRAKVLEPNGSGYNKNSVDIVIVDADGKIVRKYQSKYYKDAKATQNSYNNGDYRGQQKLVPDDQLADINKKATNVLEAPDGTTSKPLTKKDAEILRDEAQSGKWNDLNWNEYQTKDLAIGISKQAGYAALQGAAIGVGMDVAQKLWNGEKIKGEEVVETALVSGADFGVKAAAAGALKVGVEKEIIKVIPKGTPASTFANIAYVAVENIKVVGKVATGELTVKEGLKKMEQTTVSTAAGLVAMGEGATIGAAVGSVFGPVGTAVGGFVGGTVGYMAGSKVGETVVKGVQKVREETRKVAKEIVNTAKNTVSYAWEGAKNIANSIGSGIKSFFGF